MTGSKVGRLMTMFLAAVDLETGELYYINAGHNHPLLLQEGKVVSLKSRGYRLGFHDKKKYECKKTVISPSDKVIFYTDGLVENQSKDGKLIDMKKLKKLILDHKDSVAAGLKNESEEFWKDSTLDDDVCIVEFSLIKLVESVVRPIDKDVVS